MMPEEKARQVRINIPSLFDGSCSSVLYVGANSRRQHFLEEFGERYSRVAVLEIFPDNVAFLRNNFVGPQYEIMQGDVRDVKSLFSEKFDVCFFYHGPEHLRREETGGVLGDLESMANRLVVLGMPYGVYEQGVAYDNPHEVHQWSIYPGDLQKLGYETDTLGAGDDRMSNMIAWKRVG